MGSIIYSCCQCGERKNTRLNPMSTFHICRIGRSASHRLLCGNIVEEKHKTRYIHLQNFSGVPNTKTVLALLATSWAIVQVATVFVFSFLALLITRILLGAGEGPSHGTSVSAATPWLPADRRAFGLAVVTFGSAIGPALFAPPLTFLIVVVGWRSAFARPDDEQLVEKVTRGAAHLHS